MQELEKIKRVVSKKLPNNKITTLLTVDAMLGQNSFEQARLFHEATQLSGIVLTKMDGTAKGGIAIAITQTFNLPIYYVSFGEAVENCAEFNPAEYIQGILG
jgi:fused signal recognition particle receptor